MAGTKGRSGGRNKVPTTLAALRGNPGGRPLNTRAPKFPVLVDIAPPLFLDTDAAAEWRRLSPALCAQKILTEADCAAFGAYCSAFSDWKRAGEQLAACGDLMANGEAVTLSPFVKMKRDAESAMVRWAREFGFTPQSRAGIVTPGSNEADDEFSTWMKGKSGKAT